MCSETSPRISFSSDLLHEEEDESLINDNDEVNHIRRDNNLLQPEQEPESSNSDFEFSICSTLLSGHHQSSSADELFADGIILPSSATTAAANQSHKHQFFPPRNVSLHPIPCNDIDDKDRFLNAELEENYKINQSSKSIWGFKRSSSLNCDIKKSLICSLPLLSRSNSTGSAPNSNPNSKQKAGSCKEIKNSGKKLVSSSSSSGSGSNYVYSIPQKPPLKKYYGGSNGINGGVKVLNVPPPYIGKGAASLFGLGSFLRHGIGKEKNRR